MQVHDTMCDFVIDTSMADTPAHAVTLPADTVTLPADDLTSLTSTAQLTTRWPSRCPAPKIAFKIVLKIVFIVIHCLYLKVCLMITIRVFSLYDKHFVITL